MNELKALESTGFSLLTLPSPSYIFGAILFGFIGFAAFRYGRRKSHQSIKWIGIALMLYPYVVSATWLLYLVGAILCVGLYLSRH